MELRNEIKIPKDIVLLLFYFNYYSTSYTTSNYSILHSVPTKCTIRFMRQKTGQFSYRLLNGTEFPVFSFFQIFSIRKPCGPISVVNKYIFCEYFRTKSARQLCTEFDRASYTVPNRSPSCCSLVVQGVSHPMWSQVLICKSTSGYVESTAYHRAPGNISILFPSDLLNVAISLQERYFELYFQVIC